MIKKYCYFANLQSPTEYHLRKCLLARGWQPTGDASQADFGSEHLAFHAQAAACLEYKHELTRLVAVFCPEIMPATFVINDQIWPQVLHGLRQRFDTEIPVWILKPSLLNNGQHIHLFQSLDEVEQHYLCAARMGGEHVLQQYITHPHLLRDSRKYSIRMFLVLTNFAGAFLYPHGYINVAMQRFSLGYLKNLAAHLTNEHLYGEEPNVIQIPADLFDFFPDLYPQIVTVLTRLITGLDKRYPDAFLEGKQRNIALFGADFMVDETGRVWLLELNHGPCFPIDEHHPLQACLYRDFWMTLVDQVVLPMVDNKTDFFGTGFAKL